MMNFNEMRDFVRDTAAQNFINDNPDARAMNGKPYTFVVPIETENGTMYAKWGLTYVQMADTKARPGFNVDEDSTPAQEAFDNMLAERAANKAASEAAKAAKKSKSKKKDEGNE